MSPASNMSAPLRGALFMCGAAVAFSTMAGFIRLAAEELHPFQVVFFRNLFGLLIMTPWLMRAGLRVLSTQHMGLYIWRTVLGIFAMTSWFWALTVMPLAEAVSLSFTAPLFIAVGAAVFLGEAVHARRVSATIIGFLGTLIILRPGTEAISPAALVTIASAALMAGSALIIKRLSLYDAPDTIVTWMVVLLTPVSLIPALFVWQTPSLQTWIWMFLLGLAGTIGHMLFTRSFKVADVTAVVPFDFLRLPCTALIGFLAFSEKVDVYTWIGAIVIFGAGVYIAHREAQLSKPAPDKAPPPGVG
jgi:drug/metabolite transporter (DMT)-like permease